MSTIDRLFDAKRRAPAVEVAPTAAPPAPSPSAVAATVPREAPRAPAALRATADQRRDDSATVEVIGSLAAPVLIADDDMIDVFGSLVGSAPASGAAPPAAAGVPVSLPLPAPASPVASQVAAQVATQVAAIPSRRPRSRWADIASHAMAAVLVVCAGLVIAHRLGVVLPWLVRAGAPQSAAPASVEAAGSSAPPAAAVDPAPAPAPAADPPPVPADLAASAPAVAPAMAEPPATSTARRPPPHPAFAAVAPLVAAAESGAPTQATGTVLLAISPWGEVLVDGIGRGVTPPLDRIALAPGSYRFEVRNPAAPRYAATLEVRAGESVTLQHRF